MLSLALTFRLIFDSSQTENHRPPIGTVIAVSLVVLHPLPKKARDPHILTLVYTHHLADQGHLGSQLCEN